MEAAFFDLDKTVIATSSVMALGGTFYRDGLISKRTIVRGLYAQVVYLLVGADDNKMERMREAMLVLTKGWDQQHVQELVRETLDVVLTPIIYAEALELIEEHRQRRAQDRDRFLVAFRNSGGHRRVPRCRRRHRARERASMPKAAIPANSSSTRTRPTRPTRSVRWP